MLISRGIVHPMKLGKSYPQPMVHLSRRLLHPILKHVFKYPEAESSLRKAAADELLNALISAVPTIPLIVLANDAVDDLENVVNPNPPIVLANDTVDGEANELESAVDSGHFV